MAGTSESSHPGLYDRTRLTCSRQASTPAGHHGWMAAGRRRVCTASDNGDPPSGSVMTRLRAGGFTCGTVRRG